MFELWVLYFLRLKKQKKTKKQKQQDNENLKYPIIKSNYSLKYLPISSFTVFYITGMSYVSINNKIEIIQKI